MNGSVLNRLGGWLWRGIVLALCALAVYQSVGRALAPRIGDYREDILREINARGGIRVEADALRSSWAAFAPRIELEGVRVLRGAGEAAAGEAGEAAAGEAGEAAAGEAAALLTLDVLTLELDVLGSLFARELRIAALHGRGGRLRLELSEAGADAGMGDALRLLPNLKRLAVADMAIELRGGAHAAAASLRGRLDAQVWLSVPKGIGDGSGRDARASAAVDASSLAWRMPPQGGSAKAGRAFELAGLKGEFHAARRNGAWRIKANQIEARHGGRQLQLERLGADYDGSRLAIGGEDINIEEALGFLLAEGYLPPAAAARVSELAGELAPRGRLTRARLEWPEVAADASGWRFAANFSGLNLKSRRGAPGVANGAGYLEMDPSGGRAQLDAADFSADFPAVYRQPLHYEQFSAEVLWAIDNERGDERANAKAIAGASDGAHADSNGRANAEASNGASDGAHADSNERAGASAEGGAASVPPRILRLRSGPITAEGPEGRVRGLFSLSVPIHGPGDQPDPAGPGIEMELLVGIKDSAPAHRAKYLPYTLPPKLLAWLQPALGEGRIREGAFLWRGSIRRPPDRPPRRTVQLFFKAEDAELNYHPDWPGARGMNGLVLVDNANVDVWSPSARLLDSEVGEVRAQLRKNPAGQLVLNVSGAARGDAADGLHVVTHSPLRKWVGAAFDAWHFEGPLAARLQLELNLSDASIPPHVDLSAEWNGVALATGPGLKIEVDDIHGELRFDSERGFRAEQFTAELWGEPMAGEVSQARTATGLGEVDITARTHIHLAALDANLPQLFRGLPNGRLPAFATGGADTVTHIYARPEGGAYAVLDSGLEGVAVELPAPWGKAAAAAAPLRLRMELGQAEEFSGAINGMAFNKDGGELEFGIRFLEESWAFALANEWLQGEFDLPRDLSRAEARLEWLDVAGLRRFAATLEEPASDWRMPPVAMAIEELRSGFDAWGNIAFTARRAGADYLLRDIRGNVRGLQLGDESAGMELDWRRPRAGSGHERGGAAVGGDAGADAATGADAAVGANAESGERTALRGPVRFGDLGDVLQRFQYDPIIETESGGIELDLSWPGAPTDYGLAKARGELAAAIGGGRFLSTSGAAEGTLRVVGILNLAEVARQLSLDTSSIFQSGVQFDSITAQAAIGDGLIKVPAVDVQGRSSRFQLAGQAVVAERRIDGELVATLPIASNLPWVAALVSGLPAAAAVFVVSKLFDRQMDQFSSVVYKLEGPWDKPELKFQRIFDNTLAASEVLADSGEEESSAEEGGAAEE